MPISTLARRSLTYGLQSQVAANNFAAVVDAQGGTLQEGTRARIRRNISDRTVANGIITAVEAGTVMTGIQQARLGVALYNRVAAAQINAELAL